MDEEILYLKNSGRWPKEEVTPVSVPKVQVTNVEWNKAVGVLEKHDGRIDAANQAALDCADSLAALGLKTEQNESSINQILAGEYIFVPTWGLTGKYLNIYGVPTSSSAWSVTAPILLTAGQSISIKTQGTGFTAIALTDQNGSSYTPAVLGSNSDSSLKKYTYYATSDVYVAMSGKVGRNDVVAYIEYPQKFTTKKEFDEKVADIEQGTKEVSSTNAYQTAQNYALKGDGLSEHDTDYCLDKYNVNAGDKVYLKITKGSHNGVAQFQNNESVPSSGTSNLVGDPITTSINAIVTAPEGATHLIVSRPKTDSTTVVKLVEAEVSDLFVDMYGKKKDLLEDVTFGFQGTYVRSDLVLGTTQSWYISTPILVKKGQTIEFVARAATTGVCILYWVNSSVPITSSSDTRTFKNIVAPSTGSSDYETRRWTADEDSYVIAQSWGTRYTSLTLYDSLGAKADIEALKGKLDGKADSDGLPSYAEIERDRVLDLLMPKLNGSVSVIGFNTDQHFDTDEQYVSNMSSKANPIWVMHGIKALVDISKKVPFDCICLGGDVAGYGSGNSTTVVGILGEILYLNEKAVESNAVVVSISGNHDAFQNNSDITAQGMYNVNSRRLSNVYGYTPFEGGDNCCGWIDQPASKIRYIFVDVETTNGRTQSHSSDTFLASAMSTLPSGYMAVIFSHCPLTNEFNGEVMMTKISDGVTQVNAFQDPVDKHTLLNQYASSIIACICGHSHADCWAVSDAGILYIETTAACPHSRNYTFEDIPNVPVINSPTETSFDIFVIDQDAETIEAFRYGEGCNRKWIYKGDNAGMVTGYPQAIERTSLD